MIRVRKALERGHANMGWLDSYHTFSFAGYSDARFTGFGQLRVLNEDRVEGASGFGLHPHRDYEIFSYVIRGALRHDDSLGNSESIGRGDVQFTSAGKGISHSEHNASMKDPVHFLQLWVKPWETGLKPSYATQNFSDAEKLNTLVHFMTKKGTEKETGGIPINQDFYALATLLEPEKSVTYQPRGDQRHVYIHVVQEEHAAVRVETDKGEVVTLQPGDGAFIEAAKTITLTGASKVNKRPAEVVICDSI